MPYISRINAVHICGSWLNMDRLERINAASNNREMKLAVIHAQAERALIEVGLKSENVTRIMVRASKLSAKDIDTAVRSKATEYADQENERRRMSKNKRVLDACGIYSVEAAMNELYPFERRVG
jgi:hypothetical protein